jgi:apolipoprotein D and lipocalin family protein
MKAHAVAAVLMLTCATVPAAAQQPQTVPHVELERYAGKWYEIARLPNKFQAECASNVTAEYVQRPDGRLDVINRCQKADGGIEEAKGVARVVNPVTNAKLEVRFAPAWLSWLPTVWSPYWILDLAPDYSFAAVGDPERGRLWIISRTPQIDDAQYENIVNRVTAQGYDTSRLIKNSHQ